MARRGRHSGRDRTPEVEVDPYLGLEGYPEPAQLTPEGDDDPDLDTDLDTEAEVDDGPEFEPDAEPASAGSAGADAHDLGERDHGPFDATELDMEQTDAVGRLDFGSVRVPMPDEAKLQVESAPGGRLKAVHILVPLGRLSISSLAAPRSAPLWPGLADEIVATLKRDGAWVRWELGPWGREVVTGTPTAQCRFIGVDGPRWMLYGVATGPADGVDELTDVLRDMIRGTIVVRDEQPYPVRTVLPLTGPPHLSAQLEKLQIEEPTAPTGPEVTPPVEPSPPVAQQPTAPRPLQPAPPPPPPPPPPLAARSVTPPPVAPAQPVWSQPGWQPDYAGPIDSGRRARHVPGQRGTSVPNARSPEHSNPGSPAPLPLQPDSPWAQPRRPRAADPQQQFRRPTGPQQPRGVRRPPRRPADEHGVPTPPSWRAIGDPLNDPLPEPRRDWPNDPPGDRPTGPRRNEPRYPGGDQLGQPPGVSLDYPRGDPLNDPLSDPLGVGELPELGELPASTGLDDEPLYWTPSEHDRRSGRHRLPD